MSAAYKPQSGSVAWKVIQFFTTQPDEQLSAEDISVKFDTSARGVHSLLGLAVTAGVLVRKDDLSTGELVYRLGKGHADVAPSAAASPSLRAPESSEVTPPKRRSPFWLDVSTLEVRKGVPLPPPQRATIEWAPAFDRLEVGDSYPLPLEGKSAASKAMQAYQSSTGKKLAIRAESETTLGIWRTA